jgi:UTP:GlnB (protein PII) uridylyltransferase
VLAAAARRFDALDETIITPLALHLRTREQTNALYLMTRAVGEFDTVTAQRLDEVRRFVVATIDALSEGRPHLFELFDARRSRASELASTPRASDRIHAAPRQWLLANQPEVLARQASMLDPVPRHDEVRVWAEPEQRRVSVVTRDARGLLAAITSAFDAVGLSIESASAATWPDGVALSVFTVVPADLIDVDALHGAILESLDAPLLTEPVAVDGVRFDHRASPWYSVLAVEAEDRSGLLHAITAALASAGVLIHSARIQTVAGRARDSFELTDERGGKLSVSHEHLVRAALESGSAGSSVRPRRFGGRAGRPS